MATLPVDPAYKVRFCLAAGTRKIHGYFYSYMKGLYLSQEERSEGPRLSLKNQASPVFSVLPALLIASAVPWALQALQAGQGTKPKL